MLGIFGFFNTPLFLFSTIIVSIGLKSFILGILIPQTFRSPNTQRSCLLLIMVLAGSMLGELSWGIKLIRFLFLPSIPYPVTVFCIRVAWAFLIIKYQTLALFVKSLVEKKLQLSITSKLLLTTSIAICSYYLAIALFENALTDEVIRNFAFSNSSSIFTDYLEFTMMKYTIYYILFVLILPSIYIVFKKIRSKTLPKILDHQMRIILKYLLLPYFFAELLIALHAKFASIKPYTYAIVGFSALLLTYIVYYSIRYIMGLRFLNFTNHVESHHTFDFVDDFKIILEQLSFATSVPQLIQITNSFFKQAFDIPLRKVNLLLRNPIHKDSQITSLDSHIEEFLTTHSSAVCAYIAEHKILIYDEVAFSNFYEEHQTRDTIVHFLNQINADIFLPIFEKERIIGFIVIEKGARQSQLYSNVERDEMLLFASYLSNIIKLLQNRNLEHLIHQEKELHEELYKKQQEISNYKESIRSFIKNAKHKEIGIIFYKYRRFIFANQTAKEMIKVNINIHEGHPLARACKQVARQVEEYKSPYTLMVKDINGTRYSISGVCNLEQNNVILIISYPDIADIITRQLNVLKDPSKWDYLLYLETTQPGQLINQLIPSNGETLLNFKITLLQTALSKKATLLEMPEQDIMPMVELLHHISTRETLHTLTLSEPTSTPKIGAKLFGINPLFGIANPEKPLLEKLDDKGTLFIQNIEYLDRESQDYLAEFIQYGYYRIFKSEHKVSSNVRIICSTTQSLPALVEKGLFSPALFSELKKCSVTLPSLNELSEKEITELAQGYTEQTLKTHDLKTLFELTDKERLKLMSSRPVSLQDLKTRVQQLMVHKSKKHNIEQEIHFDPAYEITDPELIQASRLGKHALRDQRMMVMLWNKFRNQNKIAAFLGVNRSSVNRRCKEYNLEI